MANTDSRDNQQALNAEPSAIRLPSAQISEGSDGATKPWKWSLAKWWGSAKRLMEAAEKKVTENFRVPPHGG